MFRALLSVNAVGLVMSLGLAEPGPSAVVADTLTILADDADGAALPEPSVNRRTGVRWYRDLAYLAGPDADAERNILDLYLPHEDNWRDGRPLVVWIHGGGWTIGTKDDGGGVYGKFCRRLAEQGIAAANVGYRLSPAVTHPGHIKDVAAATGWLLDRAEQFGFEDDAVFVSGHSAGGHLAALLAVDDSWLSAVGHEDVIAGAMPSSGIFDLRPIFGERVGRWSPFTGDSVVDASPVNHVDKNDPPMVFICEEHGDYMRHQSTLMVDALIAAGIEADHLDIAGSNHITMIGDLPRADGQHVRAMIGLIDRVLGGTNHALNVSSERDIGTGSTREHGNQDD